MDEHKRRFLRAMVAGAAGGMVASWAMSRFYKLARESTRTHSAWPYVLGAGIGATYVGMIQRRNVPLIARVPLGAAVWLGEPERTAVPPSGGRDIPERARNMALRLATRGVKRAVEKALFA